MCLMGLKSETSGKKKLENQDHKKIPPCFMLEPSIIFFEKNMLRSSNREEIRETYRRCRYLRDKPISTSHLG